jgi:predicted metal-dependent HD superfamily phosphohydrolase
MQTQLPDVDTKDRDAVRTEVARIYQQLFPGTSPKFIDDAFQWVTDAFEGRFDGYQSIDAKYHDLEHTLQGTLAFARLLKGYSDARARPELTRRAFELGLLAILLHDTGYLKERSDVEGTGAKYTFVHVSRSAEFAKKLLSEKGLAPSEVRAVQNMIRCTGVNTELVSIVFHDDLERQVGFALGTADLVGQMAAPDYIEKLDTLYQEFEEANRSASSPAAEAFTSAEDLRRKTPDFWQNYVTPKIENDFGGLYRFLAVASGRNPYIERIEANISRLRRHLSARTV